MRAFQRQDPPDISSRDGAGMQFAMPSLTPVVKMLLIANAVMFVLTDIVLQAPPSGAFLRSLAITPELWQSFLLPIWQLVTYGFLHGDLGHLVGNLLFLYFLGTMLEGIVGSRRFLVFYLASVAIAGFCQLLVSLVRGEPYLILGASGGVLAIVCAVATLRPQTRIIFILFPITLKTLAILYVGFDVYTVIKDLQGQASGVASFAHLSGAAVGFLAVRKGWIWSDPVATIEKVRERRAEESAEEQRERLDKLLEKIHREGIGALSSREKAFLKKMSRRD
ncbi:MAG: rhomboid family intramembrane serine protease [Planctomycetota bacterium]